MARSLSSLFALLHKCSAVENAIDAHTRYGSKLIGYLAVELVSTIQPITLVANAFKLPIVSTVTDESLSDATTYPTFVRITDGDSVQAMALLQLLMYHGWQECNILYTNGAYGSSLSSSLLDANLRVSDSGGAAAAVAFSNVLGITASSNASIQLALSVIEASRLTVVVIICAVQEYDLLFQHMESRPGFMDAHTFVTTDQLALIVPSLPVADRSRFRGVIGTDFYGLTGDNATAFDQHCFDYRGNQFNAFPACYYPTTALTYYSKHSLFHSHRDHLMLCCHQLPC